MKKRAGQNEAGKEHKRYERERKGEGVDYEIVQHII